MEFQYKSKELEIRIAEERMEDYNAFIASSLHKYDSNGKLQFGNTILHKAALFGDNYVKNLLEQGANVNARNYINRTPLHCAYEPVSSYVFNQSIARDLLSRGADVNALDTYGLSPLHLAVRNHYVSKKNIELLLSCGAVPDVQNKRGRPPIAYCLSEKIKQFLIQYTIFSNLHTKFNQQSRNNVINPDDVMDLNYCTKSEEYRILSEARQRCLDDMVRMNTDLVSPNKTLFQFISERYVTTSSNEQMDTLEQIPYPVISRYVNDVYPFCKEILCSCLRRDELSKTLLLYCVYTKPASERCDKSGKNTVSLNWQCVQHLAEYLSKESLINMILAYAPHEH